MARVVLDRSPEQAYDLANDESRFATFMKPRGPIPGVLRVEPEEGNVRRVFLSDGSSLLEEVYHRDRPRQVGYRWASRPKPPFSWLIKAADARWTFTPKGAGTEIVWRYRFTLTSLFAVPVAAPVLRMFRGWMQAALNRMR